MTARESSRVVLVVITFVVVQQTLVLDLRLGGIHPDIMVLLPIVAGIVGGPATGASMGFGAGLVADLFLPTPFGLSALVGTPRRLRRRGRHRGPRPLRLVAAAGRGPRSAAPSTS